MSTYAIGDIQGCFTELIELLTAIQFDADKDTLWFTGDLVNRGPHSLEVLRFVRSLGSKHITVLGNHDLNLIAVFYGIRKQHHGDTLDAVLTAPDAEDLIAWLSTRPLLHLDKELGYVMTHAGLAPKWTLAKARQLAQEVETVLKSPSRFFFLEHMYGNQPDYWNDQLVGMERLRCITNYLTRMRFCYADGRLDLTYKGEIPGKPEDLIPWFHVPDRINENIKIVFGHWAALGGVTDSPNLYPLDTGCVWGNKLTALRLQDEKRFCVKCR